MAPISETAIFRRRVFAEIVSREMAKPPQERDMTFSGRDLPFGLMRQYRAKPERVPGWSPADVENLRIKK